MDDKTVNCNSCKKRIVGVLFALLMLSIAIPFLIFSLKNVKTIISECKTVYYCLDYNFINRQTDEDIATREERLRICYLLFVDRLLSDYTLFNYSKSYWIDVYGLTVKYLGLYKPVPHDYVVRLTNNQLSIYGCDDDVDIEKYAHILIDFKKYLEKKNIAFIYVQAPHKNYKYQSAIPQGVVDNSNQLFDRLVNIAENEISVIDVRDYFKSSPEEHYKLFYPGDSHWKPEYAFIASQLIMRRLHSRRSCVIDPKADNLDNYELVVTDEKRNDISKLFGDFYFSPDEEREQLLIPKFETDMIVAIDSVEYHGAYDPNLLYRPKFKKYIKNTKALNNKKLLFFGDSFSPQVMGFLTLHFSDVEYQALNSYDGNVFEAIEEFEPDFVVLLLTARIVDMNIPGKPAPSTKRYFEMLIPPVEKESNQVKKSLYNLPLRNPYDNQNCYQRGDAGQDDGSAGFGVGAADDNLSGDYKQDGEDMPKETLL